jgi:hypothetical protein
LSLDLPLLLVDHVLLRGSRAARGAVECPELPSGEINAN